MDSGSEIENGPVGDVEDTIFVAVGKSVEKSKTTLFWAVQNFSGKRVCVLHVHQPENTYASVSKKVSVSKLRQQAIKASHEHERQNMLKLLNQYALILAQKGVQAHKLWIEMENIEKGIVEIIAQKNIRWLVMGAAADKYYSKKMADIKSKKAIFVCQHAPLSCHIWFACKGYLIYTRERRLAETQMEISPPLLLLNTNLESKQSANLRSESITYKQKSFDLSSLKSTRRMMLLKYHSNTEEEEADEWDEKSTRRMMLLKYHANTEEDADEWDEMPRRSSSPCLSNSNWSNKGDANILRSTLHLNDEVQEEGSILPLVQEAHDGHHDSSSIDFLDEENQGLETNGSYDGLEQAITYGKHSKLAAFEESVKRWKAEDDAMEAIHKAKETETLHTEDLSRWKELKDELARGKEEVDRMKNQQDELMKELQMVQDQRSVLENQIAESDSSAKELEEKIISAVGLLISLRQKRDELRIEHRKAIKEINKLGGSVQAEAAGFCTPQFMSFSFMEINEATNNFDPSWKIGEGSHGSVYKGVLRHMHVAIKMLPFYGSQDHLQFQHEVEVSCRVRHPNLVTLIGTCPESRSLIYEYLQNGSLEDRLTCRNRTPPLPWQTRIRIASEICSALIFLHSNNPPIVHGNLKPTKVLLDENYVSKLSDLDVLRLVRPGENTTKKTSPPDFLPPELDDDDVYSFGIILLMLLTGRPASGIVNDVKCALENEVFNSILDFSAGEWPLEQANQLAVMALRCCKKNQSNRPDLASEVWSVLETVVMASSSSPCTAAPSATCLGSQPQPHRRIPSHFVCPIFQEVMKEPYIAADGFTYEADAIKGWLQSGHNTSPMTNLQLHDCNLLPNYALLYAIQQWQQRS